MSDLNLTYQPVGDLIEYINNSRTHSDEQVNQVAASIKEFGFTNPILVDGENGIIAGHGRLMAAKKLGLDKVPTIELSHLSDAQKKAYVIADNKLALNAGWDNDLLALEIQGLDELGFDLELLGFSDDELQEFKLDEEVEGLTDEDQVPDVPAEAISREGDLWLLGNHRVLCGDSTSMDAIDRLMGGVKVDMIFTDPPYNVAINGRSGKHDVIKNDDLPEADFNSFIDDVLQNIKLINPAAYYIWCNWDFYGVLQEKLAYKSCIVWAKNVFGMGNGYRHQHEFCLFNGKIDEVIKNESDLWSIKKDTNYVHPTQKPVELSVRAFGNHIKLLNVLDLFGGSGSTLIGAEQTGRKAFLMELDPKYVDVIINRWQDFTGKKAMHAELGKSFDEMKGDREGE
ncbi:site-specific DNA-methyltransferase [Neptuniibacter sp.]|uniref:site-specific DNA-methyltransferase n=1 Tax=Neptuniibacter sp. TaxID=1962643 RepID=UPI0026188476|nr:site-specific DNA-methyltransferase [Neptuniibacter sp.]MCP4595747.1 site-specific DNA-methyltransferase [Neptuniibacter sp.]